MASNTRNRVALGQDAFENRVERLRIQLGCLGKERDAKGGNFWYLRLGRDESELAETRPIAVAFDARLDDASEAEIKDFLTARDSELYAHYLDRVNENKPVMYLLYPSSEESGRVAFVLPQEGGLKQRDIQSFELGADALHTRLERLKSVPIGQNILCSVPLVDRVFYEPIKTAKGLAQELAKAARQIEEIIPQLHKKEAKDGYLHQLLESFRRELLPNLKVQAENDKDYSFADIYAQTVAYALFTARVFAHVKDRQREVHFDRLSAWEHLPETNPFLRKLFEDISKREVAELGDELIGAIAEIFLILRKAEMETILEDFDRQANREDIVIRFYEDFLNAYKPKMQKMRGVYYTPEPVVSYMVRSVDILLKDKFDKPLGLADPEVMILDPATGTGTFLLWICQLIHDRFHSDRAATIARVGDISWSEYVSSHLLPRIFGFELLMAPYAIAHLKLGLFLQETGYQFEEGKRLGIYLTNTLDDSPPRAEFLSDEFIAEEADAATNIKQNEPVMVVVGNPPYSGHSENKSKWISDLLKDYYQVDGKPLGEKNPKWLQDDYVKFIRFSQWRIEKTGKGILAFITNHGYLDNPTFRGMRRSLDRTFDEIYVLDLHGNTKKKEVAPDGSKDENVFDIQQGVAIGMMVKLP
jgi:predicted helicase